MPIVASTLTHWVAVGIRAADSPMRRVSHAKYGPWRPDRIVHPIWDWKITEVRAALARHNVTLPVDYQWFGRSFDGLDNRYLRPIRDNAPDDFATILEWFPLADLTIHRTDMESTYGQDSTTP